MIFSVAKSSTPSATFTAQETLYRDERIVLYRGVRSDGRPALLHALASPRPRPRDVEMLKHEYELEREIDSPAVVKAQAMASYEGVPAVLLEDLGGTSLSGLMGAPMETGRFLRIAVGLSVALVELHRQGIVHKDIKPGNVLVHTGTGAVSLVGLGIATRLPREPQPASNLELIEGSLPYMSPEQTGRMNRVIDYRTDFYSLGVMLYEMLTGVRPFEAADALEWVHCHVARSPMPPVERLASVPRVLSDIVVKLLAKVAEDRYQSADKLADDLKQCLTQWNGTRRIEPFALAAADAAGRFQIPQRLYGRDAEIAALLDAFERTVEDGKPRLLLVHGYAGIGKSALVHELQKPIARERGFFISGKADPYNQNIPYSTLMQAFRDLVLAILESNEEQIGRWRERLQAALGANGQVVVDVIPQIELIIGAQPPVPSLPVTETRNRFRMVFLSFVAVFARAEYPLALFLDDLQWADPASLELLQHLVTSPDMHHLFTIGAYRDNEVGASHPLLATVAALRKTPTPVDEITLQPLAPDQLEQLVADTLHCPRADAEPLAQLLHTKAAGNPFFALQFLTMLHEDGLIDFDERAAAWRWDVQKIAARGYTDNVVELMVAKLARLPAATRETMTLAACIGNTASAPILAIVCQCAEADIHRDLWEARREGLMHREASVYRFLHDRIRQAAYSLVAEDRRAEVHLRIGRLLLEHTSAADLGERIFDLAGHFTLGAPLLTDRTEQARVARLFLQAGRKAKASTAYLAAVGLLATGMSLLDGGRWDEDYELTYDLYFERAECEWLSGGFAESERLLGVLLARAHTVLEKLAVYGVKARLHTIQGEMPRAVESSLEALRLIGVDWSAHPTHEQALAAYQQVWQTLGERSIEELLLLPAMSNPEMKAAMALAATMSDAALFTDANMVLMVACFMVDTSLRYGNSESSPMGYAIFAMVIGPAFERYDDAYRFGRLAYDLVERHGIVAHKAKLCVLLGTVINFWVKPYRAGLHYLEVGFKAGTETGDLVSASYCCSNLVFLSFVAGEPLEALYAESKRRFDFVNRVKFDDFADIIICIQRCILNLRGLTASFSTFDGDGFDEAAFEEHLRRDRIPFVVCWYYILKIQLRVLSGDYAQAIAAGAAARALLWTTPSFITLPEFRYYESLALAAHYSSVAPERQLEYRVLLAENERLLRLWAASCAENFATKHALVVAELARIDGDELEAERRYEQAIESARAGELIQNEALAFETAARFYGSRGFRVIADAYLREAHAGYLRWGAEGKAQQLERQNPHLIEPRGAARATTIAARPEQLDLLSVIKASQTISGEIVLEQLVRQLIKVVLEEGGAQKGYLLLVSDGELRLEVEALLGERGIETTILPSLPAASSPLVPVSILQYVLRTRQCVILANAADGRRLERFAADDYLARVRPKSVLCLPIVRRSEAIGLLYLENSQIAELFTAERVAALELLAAQAAISLENARLVHKEHRARAAAEEAERRWAFVAEASVLLSEPLELSPILARLMRLCTESLADWCVIDVVADGAIRRLAWAHSDPTKEPLLEQLQQRFPPRLDGPIPTAQAIRSGKPILASEVPDALLRDECESDEHAALIRALGTQTGLAVPLLVRGRAIGALSLGSAKPGRPFGQTDLELVQELARRAAISIDNARHYRESQEAVGLRDEFLTVASHELRTPLTPLKLQLQSLQAILLEQHSDALAGRLGTAVRQVDRLAALVTDLLNVDQIGSGRLTLRREPMDLVALVRGVVSDWQTVLSRSGCTVELHADDPVSGSWDPLRIEQLVSILLSNAMKFGTGKPIVVNIGVTATGARLSVRDFGIGIAPEDRERIFERFERAVPVSRYGGLGLGLYIARQIVLAHHGSIRVGDDEAAGAELIVELPLAEGA
jgi:predicted ATPase/signal transduction histidine kinase/tRNA A-37 threonylcarbamoyl transferase component Bud32